MRNISPFLRRSVIVGVGLLSLAIVTVGAFAVDRAVHADEVLRNVAVGEVVLSGQGADDARDSLLELEDLLVSFGGRFAVNGREFILDPVAVSFDVDEAAGASSALTYGRQGSLVDQFRWWLRHLWTVELLPVPATLDQPALAEVLTSWETAAIGNPPYPGAVVVEDGRPVPDYPRPGPGLDRPASAARVLSALSSSDQGTTELPVVTVEPPLTRADVDRAVRQAEELLAGPVVLRQEDPELQVTFSEEQLASALISRLVTSSEPRLELRFDPETVGETMEPLREELEVPPQDARFRIEEDETVSVEPGRAGTVIDPKLTARELMQAAQTVERVGELPFQEGAQPDLTTEEAEALGITHKVSEFTTFHNCCEQRVSNIHLIADIIDGAIVHPGQVFSLNDHVGERTAERGFVSAPVIYLGEYTEDVGGGVSQFATTFYNTVFFGGYQDIDHQPHSYYISRYPEGREATISWPQPDLVFRNDSQAGILMKTAYTDTSITVMFYGDNGGIDIEAGLSGRFNYTNPKTEYVADPKLEPDEEEELEEGGVGWSVVVYRTITYPDGQVVEQEWPVRYRPFPRVLAVHPCKIPEGEDGYTGEECPEPTTTTSSTTTTSVPPTTSTTGG